MSGISLQTGALPVQRRDRPRALTGVFFIMCTVVLFGAFASRNNLLYWFVGMAIGAVLVHGLTAGPPMMKLMLGGVRLPPTVGRGEQAVIRVYVVSRNRRRVPRGLRIEAMLHSAAGLKVVARSGLAAVLPGENSQVSLPIELKERGIYEIESIRIWTTFPFGLSKKELRFTAEGRIVCLPSEASLSPRERQILVAGVSRRAADTRPAEIREYVRGDPRRLIAWRASARAQRLLVRELESERGRHLWLRLAGPTDAFHRRDPAAERTLDRAIAVGRFAAKARFRVGILHAESGTRVMPQLGDAWETALAEIGDKADVVSGPRPSRADMIVDLTIAGEGEEAGDV